MMMLERALRYAARGWPVFPVAAGDKLPLIAAAHPPGHECRGCDRDGHGLYDATTDERKIRNWWGEDGAPGANIGLRAGIRWWVLDIDAKHPKVKKGEPQGLTGYEMLALLEERHGALPVTLAVRTPGGGEHRYFALPGDRVIGNRVKIKAPDGRLSSLDCRGAGGYVLGEPSVVGGKSYALHHRAPIVAAPAWLLDIVAPPRAEPRSPAKVPLVDTSAAGTRYGAVALSAACRSIAESERGQRHDAILRAALKMGSLVAGGAVGLSSAACEEALVSAAVALGKKQGEVVRTVRDGLMHGAQNPRVPELRQRQAAASGNPRAMASAAVAVEQDDPEVALTEEEIENVPDAPPLPTDDDAPPPGDDRPEVVANGDRVEALARAWGAILAANDPPRWYAQGGAMVDIFAPSDTAASIRRLNPVMVGGALCRVARVVRYDPRAGKRVAMQPPDALVKDMHAYPDTRLPVLDAIVRAPVLDREGRLVSAPGYDAASGLYYLPGEGMDGLDVSDLSPSTVAAARDNILSQWLGEFPFEAAPDRAHALALVLLPFARRMIAGPAPLHLVEAAERGTGKTLLAQVALAPFLGHAPEAMPLSEQDEEVRKAITSALLARKPVVFYDNLDGRVDAPALCAALTSTTWEDRVLGASALVTAPNYAAWIATANNLEMSTDIARRSVRCRLNRRVERPWEYVARRPDLKGWTRENRRALVECALTLCLSWVQAGRPAAQGPSLGSFESWSAVMGGILAHAGVEGFLANAREVYDGADPVHAEWRALVVEWWHAHGTSTVTPATLATLADDAGLLGTVLGSASTPRARATRLGRGLGKQRGRVFAGLTITAHEARKGIEYALHVEDGAAVPPRDPPVAPRQDHRAYYD